jgi:hypothetical protein
MQPDALILSGGLAVLPFVFIFGDGVGTSV